MRCGLEGVGRILPTPPPPTFPVPRYRSSDHPNTTSPAINNCRSRAHPPNIYTFAYSMPPIEYPILDTVQRILPNRTTDKQKKKSFCTKLQYRKPRIVYTRGDFTEYYIPLGPPHAAEVRGGAEQHQTLGNTGKH